MSSNPVGNFSALSCALKYVAGFIAHWCAGTRTTELELGRAFLAAYGEFRQLPTAELLRWHTAAALLAERALRAVNRVRPEGLLHLSQVLGDAREILKAGGVQE